MSVQSPCKELEQTVARAAETAIEKRPVLETIIRPFAEVFSAKVRVARELETDVAGKRLKVEPSNLSGGIPLLVGMPFDNFHDELTRSFLVMMPVLRGVFSPIHAELDRIKSIHSEGRLNLSELSRAYLDGETAILRSFAEAAQVHEEILGLAVSTTLSPVLMAMVPALRAQTAQRNWLVGYCPICGSMPSVSYLATAELESEFLKGGGGQKYLHCSMCGHDWRVMRNTCPACETENKEQHIYFQVEGERAERIDVCQNCSSYLPCLDLRETEWNPQMDIAAVSMVHLDYWAAQKGYHPLSQTPWNLFEPPPEAANTAEQE